MGDDLGLLERAMALPSPDRIFQVARGFQLGMTLERAFELTRIDPWFLHHIRSLALDEMSLAGRPEILEDAAALRKAKRNGISDRRIAALTGTTEQAVRTARHRLG